MSSSSRSGSVSSNSRRHSGFAREIACAAGPVCQTLRNQTQSKPSAARRSNAASGMSSSVAPRPSVPGQFRQPDAGVDLVQRRIARIGHVPALIRLRLFSRPPAPSRAGRTLARVRAPRSLASTRPNRSRRASDQTGPPRLVAGAEPRAVVTVEVFVEEDQIAPVRIVLELGGPSVDRPPSVGVAQERALGQPAARAPAPLRTASCTAPNRSDTEP